MPREDESLSSLNASEVKVIEERRISCGCENVFGYGEGVAHMVALVQPVTSDEADNGDEWYRMEVQEVWSFTDGFKGTIEVVGSKDQAKCLWTFEMGRRYVVALRRDESGQMTKKPGAYTVPVCPWRMHPIVSDFSLTLVRSHLGPSIRVSR